MSIRTPIGKIDRFEIFKRDQFSCRYCGQSPPAVILEIDHIVAVSQGGDNEKQNLITACFDCNRGKGARGLDESIRPLAETAEDLRERTEQLHEYRKLLKSIKRREERDLDRVEKVFSENFTGYHLLPSFRAMIRRTFLTRLTVEDVIEAMEIACARINDVNRVTRYFCGVAWNMIRDKEGQPRKGWTRYAN